MKFDTLKEKCEYYRSLTDYKLMPNSYVIAMVDGHCFSKLIKNKFKKPFDDEFISMMNETAAYICQNVQGAKFAYTQSDEISILITDFDTPMTDSYFSYRLCKMQSLIAGLATSKFNQLFTAKKLMDNYDKHFGDMKALSVIQKEHLMDDITLCTFDCKVWTVPSYNDAFAWFLYRQNDCVRNSKQQTAQTYLPHKQLLNKDTDTQIKMLKAFNGIDWHSFDDGKKYGRIIKKVPTTMEKDLPNGEHVIFERNVWTPCFCDNLNTEGTIIKTLIPKENA